MLSSSSQSTTLIGFYLYGSVEFDEEEKQNKNKKKSFEMLV